MLPCPVFLSAARAELALVWEAQPTSDPCSERSSWSGATLGAHASGGSTGTEQGRTQAMQEQLAEARSAAVAQLAELQAQRVRSARLERELQAERKRAARLEGELHQGTAQLQAARQQVAELQAEQVFCMLAVPCCAVRALTATKPALPHRQHARSRFHCMRSLLVRWSVRCDAAQGHTHWMHQGLRSGHKHVGTLRCSIVCMELLNSCMHYNATVVHATHCTNRVFLLTLGADQPDAPHGGTGWLQ